MNTNLTPYIEKHAGVHLIGIGGVSMNSLAELLMSMGAAVSGSDQNRTPVTERLESMGARIAYTHAAENLGDAELVIRTSAVHDDNPEVIRAKEKGIPVIERAAAWGWLMRDYHQVVCLSGTHGKTTTTSMMSMIAMQADLDPTVMVGSYLPAINGTLRIGSKHCFVAEACEYCNSFLNFRPTIAVVLNVEEDHLDFFSSMEDIQKSFRQFCKLTPHTGAVVVNADDENAMAAVRGIRRTLITFGSDASAGVHPENITIENGNYQFDVVVNSHLYAKVALQVPGHHNMMNALACCAVAAFLDVPGEAVARGLGAFTGSARRFDRTGVLDSGAEVVDDYAHHPTEMRATLATARQMGYQRVICAFQPHTYTRTHELFDDFVEVLRTCDQVVLAPIYAAREQNTVGISSDDLAAQIEGAVSLHSFGEIAEHLERTAGKGDLILTMGAGPIDQVGKLLMANKKNA